MSIYSRLGFNSSDPATAAAVIPYSQNVINHMAMVPPLMNAWQQQDVANSSTSGYFSNPVAAIAQSIMNTANTVNSTITNYNMYGSSASVNTAISAINSIASNITTAGETFLYTTNRQSNVAGIGSDTTTPHYTTALGIGKIVSYIVNQSDNVQNNSPIMGSFTSLTVGNTLISLYSTMSTLSSILVSGVGVSSNLSGISLVNAQTLQTNMSQISSILTQYPTQDKQFFNNSQSVVSDFNNVNQFSQAGQTETTLFNQYIGTPKLLSRINS